MKKELFVALCVVALCFGGANLANAGNVGWTLLEDTSLAGVGPGTDGRIGHAGDSSTGENNKCNLRNVANCATAAGSPTTGSYSVISMELDNTMSTSCTGGSAGQAGCKNCCTSDAQCVGITNLCISCDQNDGGSPELKDTWSYMGKLSTLGKGTFTICQEAANGTNNWTYTAMALGLSESVPGLGGGCVGMDPGGSGLQGGTGCGVGPFTSQLDVQFKVLGCAVVGGTIQDLNMNGRVYDTSVSAPAGVCLYTTTEVNAIRAVANAKGADYLMIACGVTAIPTNAETACLRGASVDSVMVSWTGTAASDCSSECGGGCMGATAEDVI